MTEDDSDIRAVLSAVLRSAGYSVGEAVNGSEAVEQSRQYAPDLILMDLMMPLMDGWEANRRLKEGPETSSVPIVAVSALMESQISEELRDAGFCAFVEKPADAAHLLAVVEKCLTECTELGRCSSE